MNTINILLAALVLFSSVGCGKKNTFKAPEKTTKTTSLCAPLAEFKSTDIADYEVFLSRDLIQKVLNGMIYIPNYSRDRFWTDIPTYIRDELNFELNVLLANTRSFDTLNVYRTTALFFDKILGDYHEDSEYRFKDNSGYTISFKTKDIRPVNIKTLSSGCSGDTDVTFVKIPYELVKAEEVKEIYRCKTKDKGFYLIEARDQYLLNADGRVYRALSHQSKLKNNVLKLHLKITSPDLQLNLSIRKRSIKDVGNFSGKKSSIDLKLPDYEIEEVGACNALKSAL